MAADIKELVHPLVVRVTHWINVVAVLLMIASGWRIYNADPIFDFSFPDELTLGGWLAGALQWHFAAVWLLVLNGLEIGRASCRERVEMWEVLGCVKKKRWYRKTEAED